MGLLPLCPPPDRPALSGLRVNSFLRSLDSNFGPQLALQLPGKLAQLDFCGAHFLATVHAQFVANNIIKGCLRERKGDRERESVPHMVFYSSYCL